MRWYVHDSLTPVASICSWIQHCTVLTARCNCTKSRLQFWVHSGCAHLSMRRLEKARHLHLWLVLTSSLPTSVSRTLLRIPRSSNPSTDTTILPIDPSYVPFPGSPRQRKRDDRQPSVNQIADRVVSRLPLITATDP